jgi:hypothetical protein
MNTLTERVARTATLLDARTPGWASRINPETLDIHSSGNCVLGQVYGYLNTGLEILGLSDGHLGQHGLNSDLWAQFGEPVSKRDVENAWLAEVTARWAREEATVTTKENAHV